MCKQRNLLKIKKQVTSLWLFVLVATVGILWNYTLITPVVASNPSSSVYDGVSPSGPVTNPSSLPCDSGEEVLLIQDNIPWFAPDNQDPLGANVTELKAQNKSFCIINSTDISSTDLRQFPEIIISAAQVQSFYDNLFPGGVVHPNIISYVQDGGILSANLTDCASGPGAGGTWATEFCNATETTSHAFIGGVKHVHDFPQDNNIALSNHPIITGQFGGTNGGQIIDIESLKDLDDWNLASHGFFTNFPPNTKTILVDNLNRPVMIEYSFGNGVVIASQVTNEWRYAGNFGGLPQNKKLLANEIGYQGFLSMPTLMINPTEKGEITTEFKSPAPKFHFGIDIDRNINGHQVRAVAPGTVVQAKTLDGKCGDWVWIFHGNIIRTDGSVVKGISTVYLHMAQSSVSVTVGERVMQGQIIGLVDETGLAKGSHLHFGVKQGPIPNDRSCGKRIGDVTIPLNPLPVGSLPGFINYPRSPRFEADPVDLVLTDPDKFVVSKQINELVDAEYVEVKFLPNTSTSDEGLSDYDTIKLKALKVGDYLIKVFPELGALPTDVFILSFISDTGIETRLADNVLISDIPDQPYIIRSTETEVKKIIPVKIRIEPRTLNLSKKGVFTVFIKIFKGFGAGVKDINPATITLEGISPIKTKVANKNQFIAKFRTQDFSILQTDKAIKLVFRGKGKLFDGTDFEGSDTIRVIKKAFIIRLYPLLANIYEFWSRFLRLL